MSKTRGVREKQCLDSVKHYFFKKSPYLQELSAIAEVFDIDIDLSIDLDKNIRLHSFGISPSNDLPILKESILKADENPKASLFPDFITPKGFIEHFQVTSSECKRKGGAAQEREYQNFVKTSMQQLEKQSEMAHHPIGAIRTFQYPEHSYENFLKSFKSNWESHIKSLDSYTTNSNSKSIGIFLVEYMDAGLSMAEDIYKDIQDDCYYGDLPPKQREFHFYRLPFDRNLLEWISLFSDKIQFVIFVTQNCIDVINTRQIPKLVKLIPYEFKVFGHAYQSSITTIVPIPTPNGEA